MTMEAKRKRGRPGFGGPRIMLTLTPELVAILDEQIKKNPRTSRAELIRTAIEAWYIPMRKRPIDRSKSPRQ
jgi:Arc/MetJ-type ribon-helix-helix transcriptional regulator